MFLRHVYVQNQQLHSMLSYLSKLHLCNLSTCGVPINLSNICEKKDLLASPFLQSGQIQLSKEKCVKMIDWVRWFYRILIKRAVSGIRTNHLLLFTQLFDLSSCPWKDLIICMTSLVIMSSSSLVTASLFSFLPFSIFSIELALCGILWKKLVCHSSWHSNATKGRRGSWLVIVRSLQRTLSLVSQVTKVSWHKSTRERRLGVNHSSMQEETVQYCNDHFNSVQNRYSLTSE